MFYYCRSERKQRSYIETINNDNNDTMEQCHRLVSVGTDSTTTNDRTTSTVESKITKCAMPFEVLKPKEISQHLILL